MQNKLFLATGNKHKIQVVLKIAPAIEWLTINHFPELKDFEPAETGSNFAANAELKARAFAEKVNLWTVAEDSGLEVAALNNEPRIYSARWVAGTDHVCNLALLKRLENEINR